LPAPPLGISQERRACSWCSSPYSATAAIFTFSHRGPVSALAVLLIVPAIDLPRKELPEKQPAQPLQIEPPQAIRQAGVAAVQESSMSARWMDAAGTDASEAGGTAVTPGNTLWRAVRIQQVKRRLAS
jgi:hypothetical protein